MIKFVLGPNGVGKSLFLKKLKDDGDILLEVNQKVEDITSDTKSSFLVEIIERLYSPQITNIKATIAAEIGSISKSVSYMGNSGNVTFNDAFDIKQNTTSPFKKQSAGEQAMIGLKLISENASIFLGNKILVDEIDAFLHPSAFIEAASAIKTISDAGIEIWVTTHNPKLLNKFDVLDATMGELINIFYFKEFIPATARLSNINDYKVDILALNSEIDNLRSKFIRATPAKKLVRILDDVIPSVSKRAALINLQYKTVFVNILCERAVTLIEGPSELMYFDKNVQPHQNELISCFGKYFMSLAIILCQSLGIEVNIIFDQDDIVDLDKINVELNSYLSTLSPVHIILISDLESHFGIVSTGPQYKLLDIMEDII